MTLGERIKLERMNNNLSQAALGDILQLTQQAVGRWEKDLSEPDTETLKKLARLFHTTTDDLLGYEELTAEERAAGATETIKKSITPIEDEMLYIFRKVGSKHGIEGQQALITVAEKML